jgi:hypothetical protein
MSGRIRVKTAALLSNPAILIAAKGLCERVCLDRDLVVFEPNVDHLVELVTMLSANSISYCLDFLPEESVNRRYIAKELSLP